MRERTLGFLLVAAVSAAVLTGCVVDPYPGSRYRDGYDRPYDDRRHDEYGRRPPKQRHHDHDRGAYQLPTLVCASKDGRPNRCRTDFAITRAALDKRYSGSPCTYGRTWGYDSNEVWVTDGCRARFTLTPAGRWRAGR